MKIPAALEESIQALAGEHGDEAILENVARLLHNKAIRRLERQHDPHHHHSDEEKRDGDDESTSSSSSSSSFSSSDDGTGGMSRLPPVIHLGHGAQHDENIFDLLSNFQILFDCRQRNLKGKVLSLLIHYGVSEEMVGLMIEIFDQYNRLRLEKKKEKKKKRKTKTKTKRKYRFDDGVDEDDGRWGTLFIAAEEQGTNIHRILDHPAVALFRGVRVSLCEEYEQFDAERVTYTPEYLPIYSFDQDPMSLISDNLMESIQNRYRTTSLEFLDLEHVSLDSRHTAVLKDLLEKRRIRRLKLHDVLFLQPIACTSHLAEAMRHQGLAEESLAVVEDEDENEKSARNTDDDDDDDTRPIFLERLSLRLLPSMSSAIIRSLQGLSHLKSLTIRETTRSEGTCRALADVLEHPGCAIQTLVLTHEDVLSQEAPPAGQAALRFDRLIEALETNRSVQHLELLCDDGSYMDNDDLRGLFRLCQMPDNPIRVIRLVNEDDEDTKPLYFKDLHTQILDDNDAISDGDSFLSSSNTALFVAHRCRIRSFDFAYAAASLFPDDDLEQVHKNLKTLLWLASKRLPFLYDIGVDALEWQCIGEQFRTHYGFEKCRDLFTKINDLGVWLDRNQVGRGLLHSSVAPSVPLGLWPLVLGKASTGKSFNFYTNNKETCPLNGLFYLVQGLLVGGGPLAPTSRAPTTQVVDVPEPPLSERDTRKNDDDMEYDVVEEGEKCQHHKRQRL